MRPNAALRPPTMNPTCPAPTLSPARGLSRLQRRILAHLARGSHQTRHQETRHGAGSPVVRWQPSRLFPGLTHSRRSSVCKALARLAARGLVERVRPRTKTTAARLTDLGEKVVRARRHPRVQASTVERGGHEPAHEGNA